MEGVQRNIAEKGLCDVQIATYKQLHAWLVDCLFRWWKCLHMCQLSRLLEEWVTSTIYNFGSWTIIWCIEGEWGEWQGSDKRDGEWEGGEWEGREWEGGKWELGRDEEGQVREGEGGNDREGSERKGEWGEESEREGHELVGSNQVIKDDFHQPK